MDVGTAREEIAEKITALHAEYYGRPPKSAEVYIEPDAMVMVVLKETFTKAERTLMERGTPEVESIQAIRRRFQRVMKDQFISVVEQATGGRVETFISDTDLETAVACEIFLLRGRQTSMERFERSALEETGEHADREGFEKDSEDRGDEAGPPA